MKKRSSTLSSEIKSSSRQVSVPDVLAPKKRRRSKGLNPKMNADIPKRNDLDDDELEELRRAAGLMNYRDLTDQDKEGIAGGSFWLARSKFSKDRIFGSAEIMLQVAIEYFKWNEKNPWKKYEWKDKGLKSVPLTRVLTWEGFAMWCGVSTDYFNAFKSQLKANDPQREAFISVLAIIGSAIRRQKFEGAVVGAFNANFLAYDLGIRKDINPNGGSNGLNIIVEEPEQQTLLEEVMAKLQEIDDADGNDLKTLE